VSSDDDKTPVLDFRPRDRKLIALLDAAREVAEDRASGSRFRFLMIEGLEEAAIAWAAEECPICGRRGDHEWSELTTNQRIAHEAEASRQG
jgi:hypothetical protein